MKVLIYGGGSVGLGIASCLLKSKQQVTIIARKDTISYLGKYGIVRKGIFGDFDAKPADFACSVSLNATQAQIYDYIIVSTKSCDSLEAAKDISQHKNFFNNTTRIVLFQNGWGNAEIFSSFLQKEQIFNARVITGFSRPKPNEVIITVHADAIHIGSLFGTDSSKVEDLCNAITNGDIPCQSTGDIEKDLWAKMLYNCALNPLGAILDVTYGTLAENNSARFIMDNISDEIFKVLAAAGYKTHWEQTGDFLKVFYGRLVPDTAGHKSSTLQDILAKKKTEIEALNGAVIRIAEEHNIEVPYNKTIYHIIKFIEDKRC
jgi:2-dehydropantoate 2-reductase